VDPEQVELVPISDEFFLADSSGSSDVSRIALNDQGWLVATWAIADIGQDVRTGIFDIVGNPLAGVIPVNEPDTADSQFHPSVAVNNQGDFVVVYGTAATADDGTDPGLGIRGRLFNIGQFMFMAGP
jgi:hypothetical protein